MVRCHLLGLALLGFAWAGAVDVTLCAEVTHSQGAAQYAFLSYLALAARAVHEFSGRAVRIVAPWNSASGTTFNDTFAAASRNALAARAGFAWTDDTCDDWDVRVGEAVRFRTGMGTASYAEDRPNSPARFYGAVWADLRKAVAAHPGPVFRATFVLVRHTDTPLDHAHAIYDAEARLVVDALDFESFAPFPGETKGCAYAFQAGHTAEHDGHLALHGDPDGSILTSWAAAVVAEARTRGLNCAVVNLFHPPGAEALARQLFPFDFDVALTPKLYRDVHSYMQALLYEGPDQNASLANLRDQFMAFSAPLLITMYSHWSDWLLAKRAAVQGKPSVVLEREAKAARWSTILDCDDRTCANCTFWNANCLKNGAWDQRLGTETAGCHEAKNRDGSNHFYGVTAAAKQMMAPCRKLLQETL